MSRYLIRRIAENPRVELHTSTEIVALEGDARLERIRWRGPTGDVETREIHHVFMMTGAVPNTQWLAGCVVLDEKGFVKTGPDLSRDELDAARWPLVRSPFLLETTRPASSPSATYARATSNVWRRRSVRARLRLRSSTRSCRGPEHHVFGEDVCPRCVQ